MIVGERLLKCLPERINRKDDIIRALFCNDTESSAFEKMFANGQEILDKIARTSNFYDFSDSELDYVTQFFSKFSRNYSEPDSEMKKRVRAVFNRNNDTTWGTKWNVKHVFESYYPDAQIYVLENCGNITSSTDNLAVTSNVNLIENPFFKDELDFWDSDIPEETTTGTITSTKSFSGQVSCELEPGQKLTQTVIIPDNAEFENEDFYFLHFMCNGETTVKVYKKECVGTQEVESEIQGETEIVHTWEDEWHELNLWEIGDNIESTNTKTKTMGKSFAQDNWADCCILFKCKKLDKITIVMSNNQTNGIITYLGLVELFKKQPFAQFCVICRFFSNSDSANTLHLAEGQEDIEPITQEETEMYERESYHDNTFVSGAGSASSAEILGAILKLVKPCGVRGFVATVINEKT